MKRYSIFLGRKNQYCENDYTTKCNLQIQCNPYQITNDIFHRTRTKNPQFVWKNKRVWIAKTVLRKKNGAGGINLLTSDYPTKLWSSRQYGTGSKTKIQTEMEQDRKPINKPMHPWVRYFLQKRQEHTMGQRQPLH